MRRQSAKWLRILSDDADWRCAVDTLQVGTDLLRRGGVQPIRHPRQPGLAHLVSAWTSSGLTWADAQSDHGENNARRAGHRFHRVQQQPRDGQRPTTPATTVTATVTFDEAVDRHRDAPAHDRHGRYGQGAGLQLGDRHDGARILGIQGGGGGFGQSTASPSRPTSSTSMAARSRPPRTPIRPPSSTHSAVAASVGPQGQWRDRPRRPRRVDSIVFNRRRQRTAPSRPATR